MRDCARRGWRISGRESRYSLAPPADWRRASQLPCRCTRCQDLGRYLDDPSLKTWNFKAAEADRRHVEENPQSRAATSTPPQIVVAGLYSLVCTKNRASYERRARQRTQDLKDVARTSRLTGLGGWVLSQIFGRDGQGPARRIKSSGERIELLRRTQFACGLQLTFADHVHELNAREGDGG